MNKHTPPKLPLHFFRWYCHPDYQEDIEGDLLERFERRVEEKGIRAARWGITKDVIQLFRPGIIRSLEGNHRLNQYDMFKNHFKIGWRNLLRNKAYTAINIGGLSLGITCCIVLFMIVDLGRSFDMYHEKEDRIYRVVTKSKANDGHSFTQGIPRPLPGAFKEDFSSVEEVAFTSYQRGSLITVFNNDEVKKYEEKEGVAFSEPSFFRIFDRKILMGSAEKGLDESNEAIISQKLALKYFSKTDAIGETIEYDGEIYKISAIMEDFPTNTDLPFDLMLSYITIQKESEQKGWGSISDSDNCYFLLKDGISIASVEQLIPDFSQKYMEENANGEIGTTYILQPLRTLHTDMRFGNYNSKLPLAAQIAFMVIAIFLLTSACINFINLATAEAVRRTREVGVRKVLGSSRKQLIYQFVIEAFIVVISSVFLSLFAVQFMLGYINPFMNFTLTLNVFSGDMLTFLFLLVVAVTVLSGVYPAWMISGFKPVLAIGKRIHKGGSAGFGLRKGLVVFQFFISQIFIIGTIVITLQMDLMQNQEMGFVQEAIIIVPIPSSENDNPENSTIKRTLKNEILRLPGVEQVSLNFSPPSSKTVIGSSFTMPSSTDEYNTQIKHVDGDYIGLFNLELLAGEQLLDRDSVTNVVVNEKLAHMVGFVNSHDIVGKEISLWGKNLAVRGVVKDFNTQSLSKAIEPVVLLNDINAYKSLSLKLNPTSIQETIQHIKKQWESQYPEFIFSYSFLDDQVWDLYRGERKMSVLVRVFACIAIGIGCLGLLGLILFMTNQKTKEIGVRKVLGASAKSIMFLFSKEIGKLILLGFALAAPLGGLMMNKVLQEFAYKIEIGPSIYGLSLLVTCVIAFVTVGYWSFKAASENPANSLRSE